MVPTSFGRQARAQTSAGVPRPFTSVTPHALKNDSHPRPHTSVGAYTLCALRKEVTIFKRREFMLQALQVIDYIIQVLLYL